MAKTNRITRNRFDNYRDLQGEGSRGTFVSRTKEVTAVRTYRVGICSPDPGYASNLMLGLNRVSAGKVEAMVFSSPEMILTCMPIREPDLIIMDGNVPEDPQEAVAEYHTDSATQYSSTQDPAIREYASYWEKKLGTQVLVLTETPSTFGVCKYRSVREICQVLLERLQKANASVPQRFGCIAVFSPLGRCGKTALARALARAESGRGGLYIGMEEYTDRTVHSEVLYQIHRRAPEIYEAVVREQTSEDGITCLRMSDTYSDFRDVQKPDLEWFHSQLLQPERYRTLIYDVGSASLSSPVVLDCFDRIYMPVLSDPGSLGKLEHFRNALRDSGQGELLRKIRSVELPKESVEAFDEQRLLDCVGA